MNILPSFISSQVCLYISIARWNDTSNVTNIFKSSESYCQMSFRESCTNLNYPQLVEQCVFHKKAFALYETVEGTDWDLHL